MKCSCSLPENPFEYRWVSICDGTVYSDEFMESLLKTAEEREDFEYCVEIRNELSRRKTERENQFA